MSRRALGSAIAATLLLAACCLWFSTGLATASVATYTNQAIAESDPLQTGRVAQNGVDSTCATTKSFPGEAGGTYRYDTYTATNFSLAPACVEVQIDGGSCGSNGAVHSASYQPSFVPTSVGTGYLGDHGQSSNALMPTDAYGFVAGPGSFTTVVHSVSVSGLCASYDLAIRVAPNGSTEPPSAIGTRTATLAGTVNSQDEEGASYRFEYGTTTSYGTSTPTVFVGEGSADQQAAAEIEDLQPDTLYHYRIVVDREAASPFSPGTAPGADLTFRTDEIPVPLPPTRNPPGAAKPANPAPRFLAGIAIAPRRFRPGAGGATVSFALSEAARISFRVERLVRGRLLGRRCIAGRRTGAACLKHVSKGSFEFDATSGANVARLSGRLSGRALPPGRYRLTAVARDASGQQSQPASAGFRIAPRATR
jgi:hypothetical protein